ncbi:MAG: hypothetical protein ACP5LG_08485, partial [Conexivisphaera sp.]
AYLLYGLEMVLQGVRALALALSIILMGLSAVPPRWRSKGAAGAVGLFLSIPATASVERPQLAVYVGLALSPLALHALLKGDGTSRFLAYTGLALYLTYFIPPWAVPAWAVAVLAVAHYIDKSATKPSQS